MATLESLVSRVRLEIGDSVSTFSSTKHGDGFSKRFELPNSPVDPLSLEVFLVPTSGGMGTALYQGTHYDLDSLEGVIDLHAAPTDAESVVAEGRSFKYFNDEDMALFVETAFTQHAHGRAVSLATLPVVEDYPVALLAAIEALYALLNDAAFDIDVSTPEGVGIPRSQRFRQLQEMIELRKQQYAELASALNVGINRIEMFDLRRVSRTTGKLVPIYLPQEIEDHTAPRRILPPIDLKGGVVIPDPADVYDLTIEQGVPLTLEVDTERDLTGKRVKAQLRRSPVGASLLPFEVEYSDADPQMVTLRLRDTSRFRLHFDGDLFWDLRVEEPDGPDVRNVSQTLVKGRVFVIERPRL